MTDRLVADRDRHDAERGGERRGDGHEPAAANRASSLRICHVVAKARGACGALDDRKPSDGV
jgi:hypothetical protein